MFQTYSKDWKVFGVYAAFGAWTRRENTITTLLLHAEHCRTLSYCLKGPPSISAECFPLLASPSLAWHHHDTS